jgi:PAS domain S-box-containing protein
VWRADASGAILEDVVGWDTLTGQPPEGHRGRGWLDMVHPDDLSNVVQVWDHLLAEGEPGENEFRVKQGEGPYRWVSTRAVPLKNPDGSIREWVGTMTDIHTRKESEARLRQSREELQAALDANRVLLENSLDVICTIDSTGVFLQVSPHAVNVWGYTPEELAGQAFYELVHPEDREKTRLAFLSVIGGTPTSAFENRYMRKDGSVVPILWSAIWSEQHKTMFCVARDLSERLRTEEQLRQSQKMEAVGQLTGGVAHDFNNLLTVILGNAEVLLDDPANPALTRTLAQMILDAAERGAELTQHLLAFGRPPVPQARAGEPRPCGARHDPALAPHARRAHRARNPPLPLPLCGAHRPHAARERHPEPRRERQGRHAPRGHAHHPHGRGDGRPRRGRLGAGAERGVPHRLGHRHGHEP